MFTGIVEEKGHIEKMKQISENAIQLSITASTILSDIQIGDSIAVNGICLTVTSHTETGFTVDVMPETMKATSLKEIGVQSPVNLERSMSANGRFGGHFVTGHVDFVGEIIDKKQVENAIYYDIAIPENALKYFIHKGSVAVDGVSLTVFNVEEERQTITISLIPHTATETILGEKQVGNLVNMECDVLAKLVEKQLAGR